MLGIALLGGLILNLMPCVLPVLSLKLLGAIQAGTGRVRAGFLASAAGILVSFLALAGLAIGLEAMGATVGWGIQFQQPLFLVAMVVLLTLFACNLLGLFEIVLPWRVADAAARAGGDRPLLAPFATGVFATLLATPCSAPFLGTAIGFALTRGPGEIVAIFAALGIGFAAPYLLVAAFPALARLMPRPGRWMIVLKAVLAVALFGTAIWLVTVLALQVGTEAAAAIGALMIVLTALFWLRRRLPRALAATALAGMAITLTGAFAAPLVLDQPVPDGPASSARWIAFDAGAIPGRVAAGEIVFVNMTAAWCLTCQVNEAVVFSAPTVLEALAGTTPMRGDWTNPDRAISDFLAAHGRYGIPFNIVYGPGAPAGIVLPELCTESAVLDAIARAGGTVS
jgi:suppressor for copper-sensitivity B